MSKLTIAHPEVAELLHAAGACYDALTFGDVVRLDAAAKRAQVAASAIREALRPTGESVSPAAEVGAGLEAAKAEMGSAG